ncbi:stage II sporulation protein M [Sporichthya sp.]|uniref:stage II sporulation protein M n=1 Tax=Sporichthya sp. TaxID=65475 RepID=UPI00185D06BD|nr:stage II sporulation protein M [Sporichthya sp.]MBA3745623.1 stage II sporulation protein M [Sporichthya sp.]
MDIDAFVAVHSREWARLEALLGRSSRLTGDEAEEVVALYQRTATHLSILQSAAPDPALIGRLSSLVARARSMVAGASAPARRDVADFVLRRFPAAVYRAAPWWISVSAVCLVVMAAMGAWVAHTPEVQASIGAPDEIATLTEPGGEFESYYSTHAAGSFAAQVWTNNAWVAALSLALGVAIVPVLYVLWINAANVGVALGLMAEAGRLDIFLGLLIPHGLLELTAVFVAAGAGLRIGWTWIDPGPDLRSVALAREGRAAMGIAIGLVVVLLISGIIEAFVTPSGLPTWARISIGVFAEVAFLAYVFTLGGRAARAGHTGDVDDAAAGDLRPVAA